MHHRLADDARLSINYVSNQIKLTATTCTNDSRESVCVSVGI
jgi:DNA-binding Lrp family transcriptional regulator